MSAATLVAGLEQAARRVAASAEARAEASLLKVGEAVLSGQGVAVSVADGGGVALRGRRLTVRAFGSRRQAADPLFAGLLATLARGEPT